MSTATATVFARRWFRDLLAFSSRPATILRHYRREDLTPDLVAGLTVAIVLLPQAMAYALIAELPAQTGLYAAIVASIVGALWGSSSHLHTGPTNAASLLVFSVLLAVATPGSPEFLAAAALLAVMVGVARLLMGLARLGVLVNFVSDSVVIGFAAGAGILISVNQLRHLLRLDIQSTYSLRAAVAEILSHLSQAHGPSLALGLGTIVVIVLIRRFRSKWPGPLMAMIVAAVLVAALRLDQQGVAVLGELPRNLPPFAPPPLLDFDLMGRVATGAMAITAIGLVEAISIARSIAAQSGQRLDSNQEFVGQGLSNIAAGLFSGYTCSGSFTRSAVNYTAGAQTAMAGAFSGLWVLAALLLFAPLTAYLPRAALAGVLIVTAYNMVDRHEMRRILHASAGDSAIMISTLVATLLLPLEFAVLAGVIVSFIRFIIRTSTPEVYPVVPDENFQHFERLHNQPTCPQLGMVAIGGPLYFGAAHHVEEGIHANLERHPEQRFLLLRMNMVDHLDVSGIHLLEAVIHLYRRRGGDVFMAGVRPLVMEQMRLIDFDEMLSASHFLAAEEAVSHLFHKVLDPSVCIYECDVRVFAECQALPKQPYHWHAPLSSIPEHTVQHWLPSQLKARLDHGSPEREVLVVDVRELREYQSGHIPRADLLPLRAISREGEKLPADRPIVLVCRSGRRSRLAACMLQDMGYTEVYNLQGGMLAWEAAGYPVAVE